MWKTTVSRSESIYTSCTGAWNKHIWSYSTDVWVEWFKPKIPLISWSMIMHPRSKRPLTVVTGLMTSFNSVLLVKIEGSVWCTIYHQLPIVEGVKQTPLLISQPLGKGHLWIHGITMVVNPPQDGIWPSLFHSGSIHLVQKGHLSLGDEHPRDESLVIG